MTIATETTSWITGEEVARILGCNQKAVRTMADRGMVRYRVLPGMRVIHYDRADCVRILRESVREPIGRGGVAG